MRLPCRLSFLLAASLLAVCAAGCTRPTFSRVNYETIYHGQPAGAVTQTLGQPVRRRDGVWVYEQQRPYARAEIRFEDGKVVEKNWFYDRPEK